MTALMRTVSPCDLLSALGNESPIRLSYLTYILMKLNILYLHFSVLLNTQTASNPVTKTSQTKKHLLTRGETLPTAKKKKMGKY